MTRIPSDDIMEGLYKLRIRVSGKLKTVLELYNVEIHQKKAGPDYHRLNTIVKRSIEQNLRIKNFEARNGNYERNAVVKNQETQQRGQRTLGDSGTEKTQQLNIENKRKINKRFSAYTSLAPYSLPPLCNIVAVRSMLFAIHACVDGPSSSLAVPSKKGARRGPRARQCASAALAHWPPLDSNRMGAHTAICAPRRVSKCLCVWVFVCLFGSLLYLHIPRFLWILMA